MAEANPRQVTLAGVTEVSFESRGVLLTRPTNMAEANKERRAEISSKGLVSGRVAIVTGAGSGIGRATCVVLAREGARVIAMDRDGDAASGTVRQLPVPHDGKEHQVIQLDVRNEDEVCKAVGKVPSISIAINCAGIMSEKSVLQMDSLAFQEMMDVNLRGTLHVMRAAGRIMLNGAGGSIVNVSSMTASTGYPGLGHYTASKAAMEALTKSAACEWGRQGVRCNVVQPGLIDTPLSQTYRGRIWSEYHARSALGRPGKPSEVAEVIAFLASDRSSYVNGATIDITGGVL